MNKTEHYNFLVKLFHSAPINKTIFAGSDMSLSDGEAKYELTIKEEFFHGGEAMHGAIYFKLLDDAAYFACATEVDDYFLVTKSYQIEFVRPVMGGKLTAKGKLLKADENGFLASSEILNEEGKVVGKGEGIFVKSRKPMPKLKD
ncbi:MAG: PaaI family thioesterase [Roseivirga sp.]|jgi:uncharacterized protein (TIGR00369 family)|uniref:PaaI family thioesterase n=1 Tax=Roseivirga sp. TaxID=1964215 RepID=UPI001B0710E2|nr:PaaI family thioesterase [Roseivirga sp.]MBO6495448.1 PaaI family thioesterase [Roseivirga sp.]